MRRPETNSALRLTNARADAKRQRTRQPVLCYLPRGVRKQRDKRRLLALLMETGAVKRYG